MTTHLDGNVAAGMLSGVFTEDLTATTARCVHCGDTYELGRAMVWVTDMGIVVRCRSCDEVMITLVSCPDGTRVNTAGISGLLIPVNR